MAGVPNPVAYSEIVAYARHAAMDVQDTVTVIQEMDTVWMVHTTERMNRARKGPKEPEHKAQ